MYRTILILLLALAGGFTYAEELVLKDGTKIVGKMTAINGDVIEVETAYGKMQVKRADIVSINFPENRPADDSAAGSAKKEFPKVDETLSGTQYLNKTGKFSLTLPAGWKINPALRISADVIAGLSSGDNMRFLLVVQEDYPASLESYKGLVEIQGKANLEDYEKLSESKITIDGKPSLILSYRGVSRAANNIPVQFLAAIIPTGKGYARISTWCVEPLFNESQEVFEKIIESFHQTELPAAVAPSPKH